MGGTFFQKLRGGGLKRSPRPPSRNKGDLLLKGGEGKEGEREGRGELAPRCWGGG